MSKRTVMLEYLLSAVVAATPAVCLAGEPSALKPVEPTSSLRPVPVSTVSESTIQRAQLEFSTAPNAISLVQHQSSSGKVESEEKKKPSFFKRLYNKISGKDKPSAKEAAPAANANSAAARPGVAIPKPPPIDFNMQPGQQPLTSANGVSAQPTGFGQGNAPTYHPANPNQAQPLVPGNQQYQQPVNNGYSAPPRRMTPRNDGFIDPFESEGVAHGSDTFLDLDSLIEGRPAALAGAQNKIDVAETTAESLIPEVDLSVTEKPMRIVSGKRPEPAQADSTGPFSGYRLPSDDQVLGLPEPEPEPESLPAQVVQEPREPVAVIKPVEAPQTVVRVPLLEEPSMALPPVSEDPVEAFVEAVEEEVASELAPVERITKPILIDPVPAETQFEQQETVSTQTLELPSESSQSLQALDGRARREQQRFRIMSRTGKLGFKGFCPVTLRDERDLVDSREQYKAKFGLQTYYFCSPEAKSAFEANPARYAPAGGGSDVVLLVNTGEETPGSLDFSLWYRDRLYMFRSRETQALFSKDPRKYADQY